MGDGTVNVGVGVLSTYRDVRGINALKLLDSFAHRIADRWQLDPGEQLKAPTRFRVPLAGSVGPKMGPTFLVVGDAAGAASPFNGDGVDAALMSGRLAAEVLDDALTAGNSTTLQRYPTMLADEVGQYHQVGRLAARFLGRPRHPATGVAARRPQRSRRRSGAAHRHQRTPRRPPGRRRARLRPRDHRSASSPRTGDPVLHTILSDERTARIAALRSSQAGRPTER